MTEREQRDRDRETDEHTGRGATRHKEMKDPSTWDSSLTDG